MKKIFTLFFIWIFAFQYGQWSVTKASGTEINPKVNHIQYYSLDISSLENSLKQAPLYSDSRQGVPIRIPTKKGFETFYVKSFPVVVPELAEQYHLGSYTGVSSEDPHVSIRFSTGIKDFQAMIFRNGEYEFISPYNKEKTVFSLHEKTTKNGKHGFYCSTEDGHDVSSIEKLVPVDILGNPTEQALNNDQKYRTLRLAVSVTAEYTNYFGGVPQALTAINATLTRVNGVFEKDFALHLNLQNFPALIYTNPATDPYSAAAAGSGGAWNLELQQTLTTVVGNANYDIGHLFGASGGGGNAGCIGCICIDPSSPQNKAKGSGFTSPSNSIPQGDTFDIDYVAHEMGHQLGGNHTFSHNIEGAGVNVEPGSGSTIMGYAGITGANTDVQANSDPYFHKVSIDQIQANLISKTCDVETPVANTPPNIAPLPNKTIPLGTAFVLTATVTDAENNPMTYNWEEVDNASAPITKTNIGTTTNGALFRSVPPTNTATRYFPKFSSVLAGNLTNIGNNWESVSTVARITKFAITARDNNPTVTQQQTNSATQTIIVGTDGPFAITSNDLYNNGPTNILWSVANTTAAPYNVPTVKIDYSLDGGNTWVVLANSTANDGSEVVTFPTTLVTGSIVVVRVSAIGNVFYALKKLTFYSLTPCDTAPPTNILVSNVTSTTATVAWGASIGATYQVRYRIVGSTTWTVVASPTNSINLVGLTLGSNYEVQIAKVCGTTEGNFSPSVNFTTLGLTYCSLVSGSAADEFISKVVVTPTGGPATVTSVSGASTYTNYSSVIARQITLVKGSAGNQISVTKSWTGSTYNEKIIVYIDYNKNGTFEASEKIMDTAANTTPTETATFAVPAIITNVPEFTRMRVILAYVDATIPAPTTACGIFPYGEVEDYGVKFIDSTPVPTPCVSTPPTNVVVTAITSTSANVSWDANTNTNFQVRYRVQGTTTWTTVPVVGVSTLLTGLVQNTTYEIQVASVCNGTPGTFSSTSTFTTLIECPTGNPASLTVSQITTNSALVSWTTIPFVTYSVRYRVVGAGTWTVLSANSSPVTLTNLLDDTAYEVQIAYVCYNNIGVYSPSTLFVTIPKCDKAPKDLVISSIENNQAVATWNAYPGATYLFEYKEESATVWIQVPVTTNTYTMTGLDDYTVYQTRVSNVCNDVPGTPSAIVPFRTLATRTYCQVPNSGNATVYISAVKVEGTGTPVMISESGNSNYANYTGDENRLIKLKYGTTNNKITVTKGAGTPPDASMITVWLDFNRDGIFSVSEKVGSSAINTTNSYSVSFGIPANAYVSLNEKRKLVMRVILSSNNPGQACQGIDNGEIEDYAVMILNTPPQLVGLSGIQIYPNPVKDVMNFVNVTANSTYKIYDSSGRLIQAGSIIQRRVNVNGLPSGVYILDVTSGGETKQIKFLKEKE